MRYGLITLLLSALALLSSCSEDGQEALPLQFNADGSSWSGFRPDAEYIAVFGDVQSYVADINYLPYFRASARWLAAQKNLGAPLRAVLYDGDLTDNNSGAQWERFQSISAPLAETLLSVPGNGNHDFDWLRDSKIKYNAITSRSSCHLSQYFRSSLLEENIDDRFRPDSIDNIVVRNEISGRRIDIMSLEFGPRPEVIHWADSVMASHPDRRYILMTHELLEGNGSVPAGEGYAGSQFRHFGFGYSSPEEMLGFISGHPAIVAALCGHNGFFATREIDNAAGGKTPVILFNLQYQEHGGDAQLMLWEFEKERPTVNVSIICVLYGRLEDKPRTVYSFNYPE